MKWAMEYYSFSMLHLTKADLSSLSDAVKEFLFSEADLVASSGAPSEEIDRANKVTSAHRNNLQRLRRVRHVMLICVQ
jgi:hypothetical protein